MTEQQNHISYIELPARDLSVAKRFYSYVFNWTFTDYGPEYIAFADSGLAGGFYLSELPADTSSGAPLVVIYSEDLEASRRDVLSAGGSIKVDIFEFPGGRRFQFCDPNGNELAVWSAP